MATVYLVEHVGTGARYALKLQVGGAEVARERFVREGHALARVEGHPNVVRIHTYGHEPRRALAYHVLEHVPGSDLARALAAGPLPVAEVVRLGARVAHALAHVHRAGVVHRDLKPSNVLLRPSAAGGDLGEPVLTDFGVARDDAAERLTRTGAVVGTPHYMAPEQLRGRREAAGAPADLYALGVLLYESLTGELPYAGSPAAVFAAALGGRPPGVRSLRRDAPPALDALVRRLLAAEPEGRPTAAEVARALEQIGAGSRPDWAGAGGGRRRVAAAAASLALLAGLVAAAELAWLGPRRAAEAALAAEVGWTAERLEPLALGLVRAGGEAPARAELARRRAALVEAAARLGAEEAVAGELALLDAWLRLTDPGARPAEHPPRGAPERALVDGVLLLRADRPGPAIERARLVLRTAPDSEPARLLELRALARAGRADAFLARAAAADGAARALGAALAPGVVEAAYLEAVRRAPTADPEPALADLVARARALGVDLAGLAGAKSAALEASADAWAEALAAAVVARDEGRALDRLGAAIRTDPAVPTGPELRAAIDAAVDDLAVAYPPGGPLEERMRIVRFCQRLFYDVDPARPAAAALHGALAELVAIYRSEDAGPEVELELALAGLRIGATRSTSDCARAAPPRLWRAALRARPSSRAARVGLAFALAPEDGPPAPDAFAEVLDLLDAAIGDDPALLPDVHPYHLGYAALAAGQHRLDRRRALEPAARAAALRAARDAARRARSAFAPWPDERAAAWALEADAVHLLEGSAAAVEVLRPAWRSVHEQVERLAAEGLDAERELAAPFKANLDRPVGDTGASGYLRSTLASELAALDRLEEAEREARGAIELLTRTQDPDDGPLLRTRAIHASVLRRLGRLDDAAATLAPGEPAGLRIDAAFAAERVLVALESGRTGEAARALAVARRAFPGEPALARLARRLERE